MSEIDSIHQDAYLKVLCLLETNPQMSQRKLASAVGVSLGKTNFCLKALLDKGLLKMQNFQSSKRKLAYAYMLTPSGIAEMTSHTGRFLKRKMDEYELLKAEMASLQQQTSKKGYRSATLSMTTQTKLYVAGHCGMVGFAIVHALNQLGQINIFIHNV